MNVTGSTLESDTKPTERDFDRAIGIITHATIADVLSASNEDIGDDLPMFALEKSKEAVLAAKLGQQRSLRFVIRVATSTGAYLNRFVPGAQWAFVGSEISTSQGRVDLVWRHSDGTVFFDELKTTRQNLPIGNAAKEQLQRYVLGGQEKYGAHFAGVRYIPLLYPGSALFGHLREGQTRLSLQPLSDSGYHTSNLQGVQK